MMDIPVPRTYYEWSLLLKVLKNKMSDISDEEVSNAMEQGEFTWKRESTSRLMTRILNCIRTRIEMAHDKFRQESQYFSEEANVVKAMIALRKEFKFLLKISEISHFPEIIQRNIREYIQEYADEMQTSLESSTKDDKIGRFHSIIKNNRVNAL